MLIKFINFYLMYFTSFIFIRFMLILIIRLSNSLTITVFLIMIKDNEIIFCYNNDLKNRKICKN